MPKITTLNVNTQKERELDAVLVKIGVLLDEDCKTIDIADTGLLQETVQKTLVNATRERRRLRSTRESLEQKFFVSGVAGSDHKSLVSLVIVDGVIKETGVVFMR